SAVGGRPGYLHGVFVCAENAVVSNVIILATKSERMITPGETQILIDLVQVLRPAERNPVSWRKFRVTRKCDLYAIGETRRVCLVEVESGSRGPSQGLKLKQSLIGKFRGAENGRTKYVRQAQQRIVVLVGLTSVVSSVRTIINDSGEEVVVLICIAAKECGLVGDIPVDTIDGRIRVLWIAGSGISVYLICDFLENWGCSHDRQDSQRIFSRGDAQSRCIRGLASRNANEFGAESVEVVLCCRTRQCEKLRRKNLRKLLTVAAHARPFRTGEEEQLVAKSGQHRPTYRVTELIPGEVIRRQWS